ncbi:MsnO8 family LLM class oxidoreductase [Phenylobacterium sp.]|uniref:MsnO8 family LLM class oxidoreductase n=1 Tax=Phenylobacterium sp. TaxID=1871053 RepID=UPI00272F49C5|nr:MsnO8 family LLM class oxidoreductase [Phenylobacterium sp.]MDP1616963.1 MsnO8 family LLM class oxidoreductase [Phenylobacterium sp.]MDP1986407.1 MsnO8 family LLM class oxidoreductase [Phenylobacterium sp.]
MRLSVLDLSPVGAGVTQAEAVRQTLEVAKAAERLGYDRFWVAEHHNIEGLASPAPEILIAALSQVTSTIRLGSGGVMLVNYSPLKVAEVFMELEALAPGRIDLGVGRALGADGRTGAALRSASSEAFPHYFALLNAWLLDASGKELIGPDHPAREIRAHPTGPSHPDLFMLCSSPDSAEFAGRAGVGMVFAEFIARADGGPAVEAYRRAFAPSPFRQTPMAAIATIALAADTHDEAVRLDAPRRASTLATLTGRRQRFPIIEDALAYLAPFEGDPRLTGIEARSIVGDAESVRRRLAEKAQDSDADEVFVMASGPSLDARIRSLELIKPA